jgi:hypothetical protein
MTIFDAIAQDGTRERLRFETQAEADIAADQRSEAGHTCVAPRVADDGGASSGSSGPRVSSASSASPRTEPMSNSMPLVHHARRAIRNRGRRAIPSTDEVIADLIGLGTAYLAASNGRVSRTIKVELDLPEMLI